MSAFRLVVAVVLFLVGAVWIGQGSGMIAGTAMTGSSLWEVAGAVLVVVAALIAYTGVRARGRSHAADDE